MTIIDLRDQLGLVEAKLFASHDPAVIEGIDASSDAADARSRLQQLGMSAAQAEAVVNMPMHARSEQSRQALHAETNRLRELIY